MSRAGLTRDLIATAALRLVDEVGIAEFSMRKLGQRLGVDPMAVYRHFRHQEDLFDAIAELLFSELDIESLPWDEGWQVLAKQYCLSLSDVLLSHPLAVTTFATRPVRSSASIATGVRMIGLFGAAGFSPANGLRVARSLRELTIGHALSVAPVRLGFQDRSRKPNRGDPEYNPLAQAADATKVDDHFEVAVTAMLEGFDRLRDVAPGLAKPPENPPAPNS